MKKLFKILGVSILVIFLILVSVPFLFKDKISAEVQKALDKNLDAKVLFNPEKVSLSLISNFPNFSFGIEDFGLINKEPFEGDTLLYARKFELIVDFMSVVGGGQINIKKILLDQASINVLVLADGRANYNITKPSADTTKPAEEGGESKFALKIQGWELKNLNLNYMDASSGTFASVKGLNHQGSGDFTQDEVDIKTKTGIDDLSITADSANYLMHKKFASELAVAWNMKESKGKFGENFVQLNDFKFSFSGDVNIGGAKPEFDLKFASNQNELKSLLSLIPALYTKDFENLKAEGKMEFSGSAKGFYDSTSLPQFETKLLVQGGKIQYPNLPKSIDNLNIDFGVSHQQGSLELLKSNIKNFSLKLGENPFSAKGTVDGIAKPIVDMKINGSLNLADILSAFPVKGLALKGLLNLDVVAKGQYDPAIQQFPTLAASVNFIDGYIKSKDFPEPIEAINMKMTASNPDGKMPSTLVNLEIMTFKLANEPFELKAKVQDLSNIKYDMAAKGIIDLEKMTKIFPLENMKVKGRINADIKTAGVMSDVTAKRYDKLPTSGTMDLSGFVYTSKDITKPVSISSAKATFNSQEVKVENMSVMIGQSDFLMNGAVRNHLGYFLKNETLQGTLSMASKTMNVNELMTLTGEPKPADSKATEAPLEAVALPTNIDFTFNSNLSKVLYDNMTMEQMKGAITLKDGILRLKGLSFLTLDGSIKSDGEYNPKNITSPGFSFDLDMKNISVSKAYATFNTIQTLAPAAKNVNGKFSTLFKINGKLNKEMKPDMPTVNGGGLVKFTEGQITDLKLMQGINKLAKTNLPTQTDIKDVQIKTTIKDGRLFFEPFDVKAGGQVVNIGGSNGIDGTIDYLIKTSVPAGAAGSAVAGALSKFTGKAINAPKDIKFEIGATGPASSPKYRIVKVDAGEVKNEAKAAVNDKVNQVKAEAEAKVRAEADRLKQEAEAKGRAETDRLKKEAENKAKEEVEKLKKKFRF